MSDAAMSQIQHALRNEKFQQISIFIMKINIFIYF